MDIRQLRYFVVIVECGSLSKAAERLFVSQPSLSQHVANLEADLELALLLRSPQGVKPTEAGKAMYRHAKLILRQMDNMKAEVKEGVRSLSGTVALGFPTTIASVLAAPLYSRARELHPGIHLHIFESMSSYITELLVSGRLDLAILFRESETRGVSVQVLFEENLYVMGSGGVELPDAEECPLNLLSNVPIVAPSGTVGLRLLIERTFERHDVPLNVIADIDSLPLMLSIAAGSTACTILPASALAGWDDDKRPPIRRITDPGMRRTASLCWPASTPLSASAEAIRALIPEIIEDLWRSGRWEGIDLVSCKS